MSDSQDLPEEQNHSWARSLFIFSAACLPTYLSRDLFQRIAAASGICSRDLKSVAWATSWNVLKDASPQTAKLVLLLVPFDPLSCPVARPEY